MQTPDELLHLVREQVAAVMAVHPALIHPDLMFLVRTVDELDRAMSTGGELPGAWRENR
jgi:hypothetical protein